MNLHCRGQCRRDRKAQEIIIRREDTARGKTDAMDSENIPKSPKSEESTATSGISRPLCTSTPAELVNGEGVLTYR